jgi:putative NADH-flavin reductase
MRIVIFGASGRTGQLLIDQATEAGHEIIAYVRRESAIVENKKGVKYFVGELNSISQLHAALKGVDVCISVLGGKSLQKHNHQFTLGIQNIIKVLEKEKVSRFIYLSSLGVGESRQMMPPLVGFLVADVLLRIPIADHEKNESNIRMSNLNWTIVRPGSLTNGPLAPISHSDDTDIKMRGSARVSRASVAAFILNHINNEKYTKKAVWIHEQEKK